MSSKLIGLIAHVGKPGAGPLVQKLREEFLSHGVKLSLEAKTAALLGEKSEQTPRDLAESCDLLIALGGDGTILQILHDLGERIRPVFGINLGALGFLTSIGSSGYTQAVESILAGNYVLSNRTLLTVEVEHQGKIIARRTGLNDAVVSRGELSRLIKLQTRIDDAVLTEYNADGLIVATPTGSTAYSLSAGGPILNPDSGVFVINPICPHVLTNRSVIVSDRSVIRVTPCPGEKGVFLTVDGQELLRVEAVDSILIHKADYTLPLAMLPEMSFFEVLRQKLKWSGSAV